MTDRKTVKTRLGTFVVRRPTEAEAIALSQKRMQVQLQKYPVDALDDGDEEVLDCVVEPQRDKVEAALEDAPRLVELLEQAVLELAGDPVELLPGPAEAITDELREKHGARLVTLTYDGTPLVVSKIGRVEWKLFQRRQDRMQALADLGRAHLCAGAIDAVQRPMLAAKLGGHLVKLAGGRVEADQGKSPSSSTDNPA